jgi:NAD(P)-dependent dehydrogenase (short-subunit alcohol dehydrogenase family)
VLHEAPSVSGLLHEHQPHGLLLAQVAASWDGRGRVVLITGASAGLGAESARVLAGRGATIVALARNAAAMQAVTDGIKKATPDADIRFVSCDLSDLASVAAAAQDVLALRLPLHVLMLNAGIMAPPFSTTKQVIAWLEFCPWLAGFTRRLVSCDCWIRSKS